MIIDDGISNSAMRSKMSAVHEIMEPIIRRLSEEQQVEEASQFIDLAEPLPPRIPEGDYDAICLSVKRVRLERWRRISLVFRFQLKEVGPYHNVTLPGYINLGPFDEHTKQPTRAPGAASKLGRWWRVITDYDPMAKRNRVALHSFKHYFFQVRVANVTQDNRQREILEPGQGQIVTDITTIIGRRT